ncbi:FadR/GntR family transcriptional regulator [Rossellomorea marisflavi]|uniref:FadR/GntR family transcriptional regulator n=1 Tax=Rossellomorea marisflavi TaxID=189381 RepID=UPI00207A782B|nr:FadR/GntR family transcriptional regulator [Rossellomorea marisflavi]USK92100.1 FadR family transcriptional regulator [Rossellomorea marisflavi]
MEKVQSKTLTEQALNQLEQLLESGEWPIGEKIPPEPVLMDTLGISRNTLREAIRSLVHAGYLETRQGIGTTVKSHSGLDRALRKRMRAGDLVEVLELRLALEREAAEKAALRRTDEQLGEMRSLLALWQEAAEEIDPGAFVRQDIAFHQSVIRASGNAMFMEMYDSIIDSVHQSVYNLIDLNDLNHEDIRMHTELLSAIEAKDPVQASECVKKYLGALIDQINAIEHNRKK